MPLREIAALDQRKDVVRELEQAQAVRDRRLRAADPLRDLAEGELELVGQDRVCTSLLDRGQLLTGHVLDEPEQKRVAVCRIADQRRQRRQLRLARGAPAAFAGDQLVATGRTRPEHDRLDDSLCADRLGQARRRLVVETLARLARARMNLLDWDVGKLCTARSSDQDLEATAESTPCGGLG